MLSSVLRSERAVQINVAIMRAFVAMRGLLMQDSDLARRVLTLEQKYDERFAVIFDAIRMLIETPPCPSGGWASTPTKKTGRARINTHEIRLLQRVR